MIRIFSRLFLGYSSVLFLLLLPLSGCGGPASNQMGNVLSAAVPSLPAANTSNRPDLPPCHADDVHTIDLYFVAPVCTQYYLQDDNNGGEWYTAQKVDSASNNTNLQIEFVALALQDSENKCKDFIGSFTAGEATESWVADSTSLILSGLASVFVPVNTVRALSAASTGVQGVKQATANDLYQNMTMLILVPQIKSSYFDTLATAFPTIPPPASTVSPFTASGALQVIQRIHMNCSIDFAAIAAKSNAPPPTTPASGERVEVKITGTPQVGDVLTLLPVGKEAGLNSPIIYKVQSGDKLQDIALGLEENVNAALSASGITIEAGPIGDQDSSDASFYIAGGPSDLTWNPNPTVTPVSGAATEAISVVNSGTGS